MKYININEKEYKFVIGTGGDDKYRMSFNALTEKTFGFSFEKWYLFMSNSVYYIKNYDAVAIANFTEDTIEVLDVFCAEEVYLDVIINSLIDKNIKRIKLYFTPKETALYIKTPLEGEDTLFALGKDTMLLEDNQFMFPELSHT